MSKLTIAQWTPEQDQLLLQLKTEGTPYQKIAERLGRTVDAVRSHYHDLTAGQSPKGIDTELTVAIQPLKMPRPSVGGFLPLEVIDHGDWITKGLVADTHLACKEERLAELHAQYDLFQSEGISDVFHAGNIVDGYVPKINGGSVFETSIDGQCQYVLDHYPLREGITTYFITGDDHEGWWQKEGFNFGFYLESYLNKMGRTDLKYIGHVEADVNFIHKNGTKTVMKLQHPGGGSSYARSYAGQKQVESFEGGEKPDILVQGHYHVSNYCCERNVHIINMPGFQDQTIFARKKKLRFEVGGVIIQFKVLPDSGAVTRFRHEFKRYFTRGFYKKYLKSDRVLIEGQLNILEGVKP